MKFISNIKLAAAACLIVSVSLIGFFTLQSNNPVIPKVNNQLAPDVKPDDIKPSNQSQSGFDSKAFSLNEASSIWVIVNKQRPLTPQNYVPADLVIPELAKRPNITEDEQQIRSEPADELKRMFDAASADNVRLTIQSGYRSYNFQENLYNRYVSEQGQATADTQSARPGHSEHQTGLAIDLGGMTTPECNIAACFANTIEGKWLASHAHKYGFIIRYPSGKSSITGYIHEPWHLRYVGTELAREMNAVDDLTLEEFFKLPAAANYN